MKVMRKLVGGPLTIVETNEKWFMPCAKSFFEERTTTERVYLEGTEFILVVDEDGLMKELPINFLMAFDNPHFPVQLIVGDVVFIRNKPVDPRGGEIFDWEVTDITEQDFENVKTLLRPEAQMALIEAYKELCGE